MTRSDFFATLAVVIMMIILWQKWHEENEKLLNAMMDCLNEHHNLTGDEARQICVGKELLNYTQE